MQQTLQGLIADRLVAAHARDLSLTVPDATLGRDDPRQPDVPGRAGSSIASGSSAPARSAGLSEDGYLEALRRDDAATSTLPGASPGRRWRPAMLARRSGLRQREARGRALVVRARRSTSRRSPTRPRSRAYLEQNKAQLQTPGVPQVTRSSLLRPADLADEAQVSDDEVRAEYDAHRRVPHARAARRCAQLLAPDEATSDKAAQS